MKLSTILSVLVGSTVALATPSSALAEVDPFSHEGCLASGALSPEACARVYQPEQIQPSEPEAVTPVATEDQVEAPANEWVASEWTVVEESETLTVNPTLALTAVEPVAPVVEESEPVVAVAEPAPAVTEEVEVAPVVEETVVEESVEETALTVVQTPSQIPSEIPSIEEGEEWQPVRVSTEVRTRPNDVTYEAKAEYVTEDGLMTGIQYVNTSGSFEGETDTEEYSGTFQQTRTEVWGGAHGTFDDEGRGRWSVNAFARFNTASDQGSGAAQDGSYDYTWSNSGSETQVGARARVEYDIVADDAQTLSAGLQGEVAVGSDQTAYSVQVDGNYSTESTNVYAEVSQQNDGTHGFASAQYFFGDGQTRPFVEANAEAGSQYLNLAGYTGVDFSVGDSGYVRPAVGYTTGTAGDGLAIRLQAGFRF